MLPTRRADKTNLTDPSKRRAPKQERAIAARIDGRVTSGSGSKTEKGDVRIKGVMRVEAKCTRCASYSLKLETFEKVEDAASLCRPAEIPAMHIEFLDPEGKPLKGLYVIRQDDLEELIRNQK